MEEINFVWYYLQAKELTGVPWVDDNTQSYNRGILKDKVQNSKCIYAGSVDEFLEKITYDPYDVKLSEFISSARVMFGSGDTRVRTIEVYENGYINILVTHNITNPFGSLVGVIKVHKA